MNELLTAAQMRDFEAAAMASGDVTGLELMERAGAGVVQAVFDEWPKFRAGSFRAVVLCGPGNNGGDGFVVARLLKEWGWGVEVFLYGAHEGMPPDARVNYERWVAMGAVQDIPAPEMPHDPWACDLIVDAIFGTGLTRAVAFSLGRMLPEWDLRFEPGRPRIVAVDVPTGLCADSGRVLQDSAALWADLTVTFHREKTGHRLAMGPFQCGRVRTVDIGLQDKGGLPLGTAALTRPADAAPGEGWVNLAASPEGLAKGSRFGQDSHKFSHGHALILSGPAGQAGAARMTARGALRIGAGLVTLGCPPEALAENAGRLDAIMLKTVADGAGLTEALADPRISALCLGPGFGLGAQAADLVRAALVGRGSPRLCLTLDADALTLIARDPVLFALLHEDCVLTPHGGEFARLFPVIAAKLDAPAPRGPAYSKVDATREAAARAGCVVLFKGPDTVIASPDGSCAISSADYDRAAPWLATAGSGDVLAGFITGLMARGFAPQQAAETGAWLHVECARSFGPGLIAEDLPEELPKVFRALGL